jgi:mRNA-degrading endonuclease RelE of RelBE toxin-antitoxin system
MSSVTPSSVNVRFTPEFKRSLHALAKKYRRIRADVEPIIEQLRIGLLPGDHVPGVGAPIFKVRIRNTDAARGKRGGYRLLYYLQTPTEIILITIYSKSEQADMSPDEIRQILGGIG